MISFKRKKPKKQRQPLDKIDKFVVAVMAYWCIFVIVMTIVFCAKCAVPDTLIQYALGGGAIELVCTALIEIMKEREGKKKDERDNLHGGQTGSPDSCISDNDLPDSVAPVNSGCPNDGEDPVLG